LVQGIGLLRFVGACSTRWTVKAAARPPQSISASKMLALPIRFGPEGRGAFLYRMLVEYEAERYFEAGEGAKAV